jgi:hypothetical protein
MSINRQSLLAQIDKRWLVAGVAAAGASAGLVAAPQNAEAATIYSGIVNINIPSTTAGVYLNVATGVNSVTPSSAPGWDVNPWSSSGLSYFNPTAPAGGVYVQNVGNTATANLPIGALISATPDGGRVFGALSASLTGNDAHVLSTAGDNCIGFRFQNETAGNQTQYGWMRIRLGGASLSAQPRTILDYAYENTGAAIGACVIPEPASIALLAFGAAGLLLRRRK